MRTRVKKVFLISTVVLLTAVCIRIAYVNISAQKPGIEEYGINETVYFENDFFEKADEQSNGYSLTVLNYGIIKTEDYAKKHNITLPDKPSEDDPNAHLYYIPEYIYEVEIKVKNTNNTETGLDFSQIRLISSNIYLEVHDDIWMLLHPQLSGNKRLKLREDSEANISLPYAVPYAFKDDSYVDLDMLYNREFVMSLSKYPTDKRILLCYKDR